MTRFLKSLMSKVVFLFFNSNFLIHCLKLIVSGFNCNFNHTLLRLFGLYDNLKTLIFLFAFPLVGMRLTLEKWEVTISTVPSSLTCTPLWER